MPRAAILEGTRRVALKDVPMAELRAGDCVIQVECTGVCSTDVRHYCGEIRRLQLGEPAILGHEVFGRIVVSGDSGLGEGTPVAVIGTRFCKICALCIRGDVLMCPNFGVAAGGFSEMLVVPREWCRQNLLPLSQTVDRVTACYLDSFSACVRALRLATVGKGVRTLVVGDGFLAGLTALAADRMGSRVLLMTKSSKLLETTSLRKVPMNQSDNEPLVNGQAPWLDSVVIIGPRNHDLRRAWGSVSRGGRVVIMSGASVPLPDSGEVYRNRLTVLSSVHSDWEDRVAAREIADSVREFIHEVSIGYSLECVEEALLAVQRKSALRAHVLMH